MVRLLGDAGHGGRSVDHPAEHRADSIRGSAGAFGARRLSSLGEHLGQLCRESDGPSAVLLVEEMRAEFLVFAAILDGRLAALST
ncbi:hypothetical protein BH24ACT1_BH24ACT1_08640 [soil metagenome]